MSRPHSIHIHFAPPFRTPDSSHFRPPQPHQSDPTNLRFTAERSEPSGDVLSVVNEFLGRVVRMVQEGLSWSTHEPWAVWFLVCRARRFRRASCGVSVRRWCRTGLVCCSFVVPFFSLRCAAFLVGCPALGFAFLGCGAHAARLPASWAAASAAALRSPAVPPWSGRGCCATRRQLAVQ